MKKLSQALLLLITLTFLSPSTALSGDTTASQVKAEVKHFKEAQRLYLEASRYLRNVTSDSSVVGSMNENELKTFIEKLSDALKEAKLVSEDVLHRIHPELPKAYRSIFIPCIEKQIHGFKGFHAKSSIEGQMLHNVWVDWWNDHYKEFKKTQPLPILLIVVFIAFFGFLNTHQRHANRFQGASQGYHMALYVSFILGSLIGLGLLIYYGLQTAWYWPIALFFIGSLVGGLIFGFLDVSIGLLAMSLASFLGWPICAYIMYKIMSHLGP